MSLTNFAGTTARVVHNGDGVTYSAPNQWTLNLPNGFNSVKNEMALGAVYLNYSWFNITAALGNNAASYKFNGLTRTLNFNDGMYQYADWNAYMQAVMFANGDYLLDANKQPVYYLSVAASAVRYAIAIVATALPTVLPTGWSNTNPVRTVTLDGLCPQLIISSTALGTYLGYATGTYPAVNTASSTVSSTAIPSISNVTAVNVTCSMLAANPFSTRSNVLATFTPQQAGASPGTLISLSPYNPEWIPIGDTNYSSITVGFIDQLGNALQLYDPTGTTFSLKIRPRGRM